MFSNSVSALSTSVARAGYFSCPMSIPNLRPLSPNARPVFQVSQDRDVGWKNPGRINDSRTLGLLSPKKAGDSTAKNSGVTALSRQGVKDAWSCPSKFMGHDFPDSGLIAKSKTLANNTSRLSGPPGVEPQPRVGDPSLTLAGLPGNATGLGQQATPALGSAVPGFWNRHFPFVLRRKGVPVHSFLSALSMEVHPRIMAEKPFVDLLSRQVSTALLTGEDAAKSAVTAESISGFVNRFGFSVARERIDGDAVLLAVDALFNSFFRSNEGSFSRSNEGYFSRSNEGSFGGELARERPTGEAAMRRGPARGGVVKGGPVIAGPGIQTPVSASPIGTGIPSRLQSAAPTIPSRFHPAAPTIDLSGVRGKSNTSTPKFAQTKLGQLSTRSQVLHGASNTGPTTRLSPANFRNQLGLSLELTSSSDDDGNHRDGNHRDGNHRDGNHRDGNHRDDRQGNWHGLEQKASRSRAGKQSSSEPSSDGSSSPIKVSPKNWYVPTSWKKELGKGDTDNRLEEESPANQSESRLVETNSSSRGKSPTQAMLRSLVTALDKAQSGSNTQSSNSAGETPESTSALKVRQEPSVLRALSLSPALREKSNETSREQSPLGKRSPPNGRSERKEHVKSPSNQTQDKTKSVNIMRTKRETRAPKGQDRPTSPMRSKGDSKTVLSEILGTSSKLPGVDLPTPSTLLSGSRRVACRVLSELIERTMICWAWTELKTFLSEVDDSANDNSLVPDIQLKMSSQRVAVQLLCVGLRGQLKNLLYSSFYGLRLHSALKSKGRVVSIVVASCKLDGLIFEHRVRLALQTLHALRAR